VAAMTLAAVLEDRHGQRDPVSPRGPSPSDPAAASRPESEGRAGEARVVLIAEDDASLRQTLAEIFELEGHECRQAADGETALSMLLDDGIDVLVLDLHMPRRDGLSLLHEIDPPPPAVVIYSAFEFYSPDEVERAAGSKVFRWLRKPTPPAQIVAAVSAAIEALPDDD
jgi:DNA-binding response OmpR family regulator